MKLFTSLLFFFLALTVQAQDFCSTDCTFSADRYYDIDGYNCHFANNMEFMISSALQNAFFDVNISYTTIATNLHTEYNSGALQTIDFSNSDQSYVAVSYADVSMGRRNNNVLVGSVEITDQATAINAPLELRIWTPSIESHTCAEGYVLTCVDSATGEANFTAPPDFSLCLIATAGTAVVYNNQPSGENLYGATDRMCVQYDSGTYNYCRMVAYTGSTGYSGSVCYPAYSTNGVSWTAIGTTAGSDAIPLSTSAGFKSTAWIELPSRGDLFWGILSKGGNGGSDPSITSVQIQFSVKP